mgnify:CR=1 FL=1
MPIKIPTQLPAAKVLQKENVFFMSELRAMRQDIRPLRILLLNLMPTKITTETQLLRLLGNSPLQVEVDLMQTKTHQPKNTPPEHLLHFYHTFDDYCENTYDGMIITGAPVEQMAFEEVHYWEELCRIMEWSKTHVTSTFHICWGAQAALYYHYGIEKRQLPQKLFGVFEHRVLKPRSKLVRGFDDCFYAPHSRHTDIDREQLEACGELDILADSEEAGVYIAATRGGKQFFITGHSEYDPNTLAEEYARDLEKGCEIALPKHYFPGDNPRKKPCVTWRSHANLLYSNWLNYYVYQITPYDISKVTKRKKS